ncbi:hypothetical protein LLEC1_00797 [Akanthomyces lecanii]|uniref:6-phosphogluconate dehydrogenase NADP-binding domain-containing protein n=1 Tax=Cordyceps confragosa TaxID=2714763 RepID=A0A179I917_CORDF|nr:hypothetical protein LLEC1_00797 [Akanthomyces lecanii]
MRVGFMGLGFMGSPMALNLSQKFPLTVWNRTATKCAPFRSTSATIADTPAAVLRQSDVVFTMLINETAYRAVLDKDFTNALHGKTIAAVYCGEIGMGLRTKFAINLFLITMTAGLAESMNLARAQGVDVDAFGEVLDAGPMASAYSRLKVAKMIAEDWSPQAAMADCSSVTGLVQEAAAEVGAQTPLMTVCDSLYKEAVARGFGGDDMIAIHQVMTPAANDA